jgi:acyl-coenzyme A synthetase/AMP-(fatty) acid ligase
MAVPHDNSQAVAHGMLVTGRAPQGSDGPAWYMVYGDRTSGELTANVNRKVRALPARRPRPVGFADQLPREDTAKIFKRKPWERYRQAARTRR